MLFHYVVDIADGRGDMGDLPRREMLLPAQHSALQGPITHVTPGLTGQHVLSVMGFSRDKVSQFFIRNYYSKGQS